MSTNEGALGYVAKKKKKLILSERDDDVTGEATLHTILERIVEANDDVEIDRYMYIYIYMRIYVSVR